MNDPVNILCTVSDDIPKEITDDFLNPFILPEEIRKITIEQLSKVSFELTGLTIDDEKNNLEATNCDLGRYDLLLQLKEIYSQKDVKKYLPLIYPYENANESIFLNRCSLKLANLDKIFLLTGHLTGAISKQVPGKFMFCDIAGGPGGFSQYLQWRWPHSMGYGITYKKVIDWKVEFFDRSRFNFIYGSDSKGDGNLYSEWNFFATTIQNQSPQGVDLVVADGGFDVTRNDDFDRQEFLSNRLILIEILLGILLCKATGEETQLSIQYPSFVFKVFDTVTEVSAFLLFACSLAFEEVHIWKPVMSRWTNSERYVICRNKKPNNEQLISLLVRMIESESDNQRLSKINGIFYTEEFIKWLTERNNESIELQIKTASQMIKLINDEEVTDLPKINLHQLLIVLDLPGERYKERKGEKKKY